MSIRLKSTFFAAVIFAGLVILGILIALSFNKTVHAQPIAEHHKYFTTVQVQEGDSLWSIAKENITDEYSDIRSYIKEIKESNNLRTDKIKEGSCLTVPYYAAEPRQ